MTYLKCTSCKVRLYSAATSGGLAAEFCPSCGATLEPVGELVEVLGYRSIEFLNDPAPPQAERGAVIDRFADLLAAKRAREEQADNVYDALVISGEAAALTTPTAAATADGPPGHLLRLP
jgi:hypothetical protein